MITMGLNKLKANNIFKRDSQFHFANYTTIDKSVTLHQHNFYEIFLVTSGHVQHIINGEQQLLQANTIVFIRPDDRHYYKETTNEVSYFNLAFTSHVMDKLLQYIGNTLHLNNDILTSPQPPFSIITEKNQYIIDSKVNIINTIPLQEHKIIEFHYYTLLLDLFNYLFFGQNMISKKTKPYWLESIYNKMRERENFIKGIDQLYKLSDKSQEYTCRMFKKYFRQTPTEYVNDLRLNYTANLLSKTDSKIVNLAFEAGFNNLSHFYHLFNEKYQISPGEYRKKYGKRLV